jgi:hypothetical protein
MTRDISAALKARAQSQHFTMLVFVQLEFDSGTIYMHNGIGNYSFGGHTYGGVGAFGAIDAVQEGDDLSPYSITLILSGLDADLMDEVQNQDYYLRPVTVLVGSLDADMQLVADPDEMWSGFMDSADFSLGDENSIRITCESHMAVFDQSNNARYSDADLQREYNGDLFMQYAEEMVEATVVWRGQGQSKVYNPNPISPQSYYEGLDYSNWNY